MRLQHLDWSTINLKALTMRPRVVLTHGDRLQDDCGNGCAGDPPGFPTYFTRSVYSASGNDPHGRWHKVISHGGVNYGIEGDYRGSWDEHREQCDQLMRLLWKPLPIDHPRTVAWIDGTFKHHHSCYQAPGNEDKKKNWSDNMMIWPGGCLGNTPFGKLQNEKWEVEWAKERSCFDKWRPEEQAKFIADIKANNDRITRQCREIATPDNHDGTIIVRRYYPQFKPNQRLISGLFESPGNWWETMATRPTPEECPGQYSMKHPCNGGWCQMCGWHAPEEK